MSPGQPRDLVPPACPESSKGPPGETCQEYLIREASEIDAQPTQLTPFNVVEQWLYSKLHLGDGAHPISKGVLPPRNSGSALSTSQMT